MECDREWICGRPGPRRKCPGPVVGGEHDTVKAKKSAPLRRWLFVFQGPIRDSRPLHGTGSLSGFTHPGENVPSTACRVARVSGVHDFYELPCVYQPGICKQTRLNLFRSQEAER